MFFLPRKLLEFLKRLNGTLIPCCWEQRCSHCWKNSPAVAQRVQQSCHVTQQPSTPALLCPRRNQCAVFTAAALVLLPKGHQLRKRNTQELGKEKGRSIHSCCGKNTMPHDRSQSQKATSSMTAFTCNFQYRGADRHQRFEWLPGLKIGGLVYRGFFGE